MPAFSSAAFFVVLWAVLVGLANPPSATAAPARAAAAPAPAVATVPAPAAAGARLPAPATPTAPAAVPTDARTLAEARMHFDAGTDHYAKGRYEEAIRSFQAGYALVPRASFLVNIGQAYRKLGELVRAKEAYVAYVRALPENSAIRDQALQVLAEIEVQLHDGKESPMRALDPQRWDLEPGVAPAPVLVSAPPPPRTGAWLGLAFGGAGLALAATGVGFELRAKAASDALADASRNGRPFDANEERAGKRAEKIGNGLLFAGGAAMAAGLLVFLVVDAASSSGHAAAPSHVAVTPEGVGLGWRF